MPTERIYVRRSNKPQALVITGLGNPGEAKKIKLKLENKGYEVRVIQYDQKIPNENYDVLVSHSAGTISAQLYAHENPNTEVYLLGSPFQFNFGNNVQGVSQLYDPVTWLNPATWLGIGKRSLGRVHNKSDMFEAIAGKIPDVNMEIGIRTVSSNPNGIGGYFDRNE